MASNPFGKEPADLYRPVDYILSLGGKRLRPAILLLSYYLFDDEVEKALPAAYSVEIFHNFSLVHDDIMDAAPLRRGQATVHSKYGLNAGILSGDVMLASSYGFLLKLENKALLPQVMEAFTRMAIEVCEGQQMDMDFEKRQDVAIPEYLKMIELKTSVLVAVALKIGALLSGTSTENADNLYEFGRNLGIAFQLQDDLLDTFGDPEKVGKKTGGDIAQNKKTFLYLKALELANEADKKQLLDFFNGNTGEENAKVKAVIGLFRKYGIEQETELLKESYRKKALASLEKVAAKNGREKLLREFADNLMQREY